MPCGILYAFILVFIAGHGVLPRAEAERLAPATLEIAGARIDIAFSDGRPSLTRDQILAWITESAQAVGNYYGCFPVPRLRIRMQIAEGKSVRFGTAFPGQVPRIRISLGKSAGPAALKRDWVMVHEMVHLAFPSVPDQHHWLEEGLATYVEPIARHGIRSLHQAAVWGQLVEGLPKGLPQVGDRGLDHTPTWGRTYWGGALFCTLADVEIRKQTKNQFGLQDALRAIVKASGGMRVSWPLAKALEIGDQATGVTVLQELYEQMKASPVEVDLDDLWQQLGVKVNGKQVSFHDEAPLAAVRKAIHTAARGQFDPTMSLADQHAHCKTTM